MKIEHNHISFEPTLEIINGKDVWLCRKHMTIQPLAKLFFSKQFRQYVYEAYRELTPSEKSEIANFIKQLKSK